MTQLQREQPVPSARCRAEPRGVFQCHAFLPAAGIKLAYFWYRKEILNNNLHFPIKVLFSCKIFQACSCLTYYKQQVKPRKVLTPAFMTRESPSGLGHHTGGEGRTVTSLLLGSPDWGQRENWNESGQRWSADGGRHTDWRKAAWKGAQGASDLLPGLP